MKNSTLAPVIACMLAASAPPLTADTGNGQALIESKCISCHDDKVYTREDRRVTTLQGLKKQVTRCELSLGLKWFDSDIEDVVNYLNQHYYKFE